MLGLVFSVQGEGLSFGLGVGLMGSTLGVYEARHPRGLLFQLDLDVCSLRHELALLFAEFDDAESERILTRQQPCPTRVQFQLGVSVLGLDTCLVFAQPPAGPRDRPSLGLPDLTLGHPWHLVAPVVGVEQLVEGPIRHVRAHTHDQSCVCGVINVRMP